MVWLFLAVMPACAADASPKPPAAGICPLRTGASPSQIDVFDGDPSEQVILAPDCGMKYLPRDVAYGKLASMVEAARVLRQEYGAAR